MSTTTIPSLIGPVETGASFMLASIQNGQPYILNGAPFNNGTIYYWESNLATITTSSNLGLFKSTGNSLNSLIITDYNNGGGIGFRSDGTTIGNSPTPPQITMTQSTYANWYPPDIFLSSVQYNIFNPSGGTASVFTAIPGTGGTGGTAPTILANNIIILPVLWYSACTSSGGSITSNSISDPIDSIVNWFCLVQPGNTGCSGISLIKSGWTNIPDCIVGNMYSYCPAGDTCGANNCNGPCSVIYDDCNFSSSNQYVCVFDPAKYFEDTKWWLSPYFIGTVVAIIVIIIILIIVTFAVARHGKKTSKPPSDGYESYYIQDS